LLVSDAHGVLMKLLLFAGLHAVGFLGWSLTGCASQIIAVWGLAK
jgi:hypothetical protein